MNAHVRAWAGFVGTPHLVVDKAAGSKPCRMLGTVKFQGGSNRLMLS